MVRAETRSRKPDIKTQTNNSSALRFLLSTCFMLEAMFGYLTTCRPFVDLFCSRIHSSRFPTTNNMGDKVLLNFGAKFERYFLISHVILQCCHGNFPTTPKGHTIIYEGPGSSPHDNKYVKYGQYFSTSF